ncbi:MAG: hypothetical protein ACTHJY_02690, partial [Rhizobiaceae bacterium]
ADKMLVVAHASGDAMHDQAEAVSRHDVQISSDRVPDIPSMDITIWLLRHHGYTSRVKSMARAAIRLLPVKLRFRV